jgi:integrase/recombinase XerD
MSDRETAVFGNTQLQLLPNTEEVLGNTVLVPAALRQPILDVLGQLAPSSRRIYLLDLRYFLTWMLEHDLEPQRLTRSHLIVFRAHLADTYAKATAARMLSAVRQVLAEFCRSQALPNPAEDLAPFRLDQESPHIALTRVQARELLQAIDTSSVIGLRNYAILKLLLRTGLRRSECARLNLGDLVREAGHYIAIIQHGKGDKRRIVKLPVDVFRAIEAYIQAAYREHAAPSAPLFVQIKKGSRVTESRISDKVIERLVASLREQVDGLHLTPHGLRATFITLALEGGASLHQVQFTAGHRDPRTTERYHRRKLNLDDSAVDYVRIDA